MKLFNTELKRVVSLFYGNPTAHANRVGLAPSTLTRACNEDADISPEALEAVIRPMAPEHRATLAEAYLMDIRARIPSGSMVRVSCGAEDHDRLQRAINLLPASSREKLAAVIDAINRDPAVGYPMLDGLAAMISPPVSAFFGLNEDAKPPKS